MATRRHALYRLLPEPAADAAQAGCYLTGDRGPCVDTGALIFQEGTLTLSTRVIRELAEVAGFSVNEEAEQLEQENAILNVRVERMTAELDDLRAQLDAVAITIARATAPTATS